MLPWQVQAICPPCYACAWAGGKQTPLDIVKPDADAFPGPADKCTPHAGQYKRLVPQRQMRVTPCPYQACMCISGAQTDIGET